LASFLPLLATVFVKFSCKTFWNLATLPRTYCEVKLQACNKAKTSEAVVQHLVFFY